MTLETSAMMQNAVSSKRRELIEGWRRAQFAGVYDDEYGTGFWSGRIRQLNDAAIACGFGYKLI